MISLPGDPPEDFAGVVITTPDFVKQEPRDFLLTGRIQKRNSKPITVGEMHHRDRGTAVLKLEDQIRRLQDVSGDVDDEIQRYRPPQTMLDSDRDDDAGPMKKALDRMRLRL